MTRQPRSEFDGRFLTVDDGAGLNDRSPIVQGDEHANAYGRGAVAPVRETTLLDYLPILYRRRWAAIGTLVLVIVAVAAYTFSIAPTYEARGQLLMVESQNVVTFDQGAKQPNAQQDYYETQYRLLQSRSLARKVLDKLALWHTPPFGGNGQVESPGPLGTLRIWALGATASLRQRTGFTTAAPASHPAGVDAAEPVDETAEQSRAISRLLSNLKIVPIADSRVVEVRYISQDPQLAAKIVNTLAAEFIEQNLEFKFRASRETAQWLTEQLGEQRVKVEASELALQRYRERANASSLGDGQNIVLQRLSDLNTAATRARTARFEKEALYRQLLAVQHDPEALDSIPAVFSNGFIQGLKSDVTALQRERADLLETLGAKHPDVIRVQSAIENARLKLATEVGNLVEAVHQEYLATLSEEQSLSQDLEEQKKSALALNRQAIDYGVLQREAESNRQVDGDDALPLIRARAGHQQRPGPVFR